MKDKLIYAGRSMKSFLALTSSASYAVAHGDQHIVLFVCTESRAVDAYQTLRYFCAPYLLDISSAGYPTLRFQNGSTITIESNERSTPFLDDS